MHACIVRSDENLNDVNDYVSVVTFPLCLSIYAQYKAYLKLTGVGFVIYGVRANIDKLNKGNDSQVPEEIDIFC